MPKRKSEGSNRIAVVLIAGVVLIILIAGGLYLFKGRAPMPETTSAPASPTAQARPEEVRVPVKGNAVIDYNAMEKDPTLKGMMDKRKAEYGVNKGIDIIAKSNESVKIGDNTISMQEIVDQIRIRQGDIVEKDVAESTKQADKKPTYFGIYVVQPGDNIWNIHFKVLKDYFNHRGISLSPLADEPNPNGSSSGVGKLLKFSENMVYIYNIEEKKLDVDLNLIRPLSKIVVYNMTRIFALLDGIDTTHVNRIQFDGETIWIPAKQ